MTQTAPVPLVASAPLPAISPAPARTSGLTGGIVLAVISALAFSSSGPLIKPLLAQGWSLTAVLTVRMGVSGLILLPALVRVIRRDAGFLRRHAMTLLWFGLIPVAGCQFLFFSAMQRMPVAIALLIQYLAPVFLVVFVWLRTRRRPSRLVLAGSLVAIVGLVLVVDIAGARFDLIGTVLALGAAITVVVYFLLSEKTGDDLPPLALASGGLLIGAVAVALVGAVGVIPFAAPEITVTFRGVEMPGWMPLLWVAAIGTTLGYAFGVMAVPRVGARLASFIGLSEVLFALLFAWLLLREAPGPIQAVGGALILTGVILVRLDAGEHPVSVTALGEPLPAGDAPDTR